MSFRSTERQSSIRATNHELHLPDEQDVIAQKYIHCSANWNAIMVNTDGFIHGGASPSELIGFINRPDEQWKRSIYSMDGEK
ncbi:TPA: hypothetical protein ACHGIE_004256 [Escherichia coli]|nr:hypothetical protein [Escherichia coli]EJH9885080.1 hypothetical protein [Escherichia coli]